VILSGRSSAGPVPAHERQERLMLLLFTFAVGLSLVALAGALVLEEALR
jgi:hypothetical protein